MGLVSGVYSQEGKTETSRRGRGKKDKGGQERVVQLEFLVTAQNDLGVLYAQLKEKREAFNAAVKKAAEKCGLNAANVRAFVVAKAGDLYEDELRKAEQKAMLLAEMKGKTAPQGTLTQ